MIDSPKPLKRCLDCDGTGSRFVATQENAGVEEAMTNETQNRPTNEYWDTARPTFMENWPGDLHSLSIPSYSRKLTRDEALVLGHDIVEWGEGFDVSNLSASQVQAIRTDLIQWMDAKVKTLNGAFVRLGSRSPKDALYWGCKQGDDPSGKVMDGEKAYWRLTACSERVSDDLHMQIVMNYEPHIFLRQWVDLPEWTEFRCFQRDQQLIGISQYYYRGVYPEIANDASGLKWAIEQFHANCFSVVTRDYPHLKDVVFDVFIKRQMRDATNPSVSRSSDWRPDAEGKRFRYEVKLLEINPLFNLTDPCLFDWNKPEEFTGTLKYRTQLGPSLTSTAIV